MFKLLTLSALALTIPYGGEIFGSPADPERSSEPQQLLKWAIENPDEGLSTYRYIRPEAEAVSGEEVRRFPRLSADGNLVVVVETQVERWSSPEMQEFARRSQGANRFDSATWVGALNQISIEDRIRVWMEFSSLRDRMLWQEYSEEDLPDEHDRGRLYESLRQKQPPIGFLTRHNGLSRSDVLSGLEVSELVEWIEERRSTRWVQYDNHLGEHRYRSSTLEAGVELLWRKLSQDASPESLRDELTTELWESLTRNESAIEGVARIDLFNLIETQVKRDIGQELPDDVVNPQHMRLFVRHFLRSFFELPGIDESRGFPVLIMQSPRTPEAVSLLCAHSTEAYLDSSDNGVRRVLRSIRGGPTYVSIPVDQIEEARGLRLSCGPSTYDVELDIDERDLKIPFPEEPSVSGRDEFRVVVSFSLLESVQHWQERFFVKFIEDYGGYTQTEAFSALDDVEGFVREELLRAQLFVPVAHQININELPLSPHRQVRASRFERTMVNEVTGKSVRVIGYVLIPAAEVKSEGSPVLTQKDLVELFKMRRERAVGSLMCLTMSCHSDTSIGAWFRAYRNSFQEGVSQESIDLGQDVPVVIGVPGGLEVDSPASILSHMAVVMEIIDAVTSGEELTKRLHRLSSEAFTNEFDEWRAEWFRESLGFNPPVSGLEPFESVSSLQPEYEGEYHFRSAHVLVQSKTGNTLLFPIIY